MVIVAFRSTLHDSTFITVFAPTYRYNPPPPQFPLVVGTFPLPVVYEPPLHAFVRVLWPIMDPDICKKKNKAVRIY